MATHYRPSIRFSFQSMLCLGMDPRTVFIEVVLKYKRRIFLRNRRGEVVDFYETNADSHVSFPFRFDSPIPALSCFNFTAQIRERMPGLSPSLCTHLSQHIFLYAQRLALTRHDLIGGAAIVTAFVEIEEPELRPTDDDQVEVYTGLRAEIVDDGIVLNFDDGEEESSNPPPRGLTWGEINGLKQERFNSGADESSFCSICLEEFSAGVKITPLACSHTFHHTCIATWLQKQGSCPLCRFHITQPCS